MTDDLDDLYERFHDGEQPPPGLPGTYGPFYWRIIRTLRAVSVAGGGVFDLTGERLSGIIGDNDLESGNRILRTFVKDGIIVREGWYRWRFVLEDYPLSSATVLTTG